jgi:ribulose-phosphate 3-epimerase
MVKALRKCSADTILDVHMCVDRPARYVRPMKDAGANLFIFQWEAVADKNEALELARAIVDAGMECGLSINPSTGNMFCSQHGHLRAQSGSLTKVQILMM